VNVPRRYNGPPGSANGGYACGLVAEILGGVAEVTLRRPPPLERELEAQVHLDGESVDVHDGETLVAEGRKIELEVEAAEPVPPEAAEEASRRYAGFDHHAYPTCFTCGPKRDDGLGIFAGPVGGRAGVVAAPWTLREAPTAPVVWAALDCPGGWAVDDFQREGVLLGRMAAHVLRLPNVDEPHVVLGWRIGEEGRKRYAASAVYDAAGEVLATARSTWIVPAH
jgi:hypothetical protein